MKKEIRKAILEAKEKKETLLIEQEISIKRFSFILKDIKSKKDYYALTENKKIKLLFSIANEYNSLSNSIVSESFDLGGILKGLLGNLFGGSTIETIAEPFVNALLTKLGMPQGFWKNFLISFITTNPTEFLKSFSDCKIMTKLLTRSLVEGLVMNLQTQSGFGGFFPDLVRNVLGDTIRESDFVSGIENGLSGTICSLFDKFSSNASSLKNTLSPIMSQSPTT